MANSWFRLYAEFANDAKVQMLAESDQRRLLMLFCFRCNGDVTLQDEEVAFQLRISNEEWLKTKAIFMAKGFIDSNNEVLNWDRRQFVSDSSAERVARHRAKAKSNDVTPSNVTVTPQNRTDTDTEQIQNKTKTPSPRALLEAENIPSNLIDDWLKVRKAKNQPLTETALKATKREAYKATLSLEAAITICCERSWAGFKAEYLVNQSASKGTVADQNKASTEAARKKLFGTMPTEKDVTNA